MKKIIIFLTIFTSILGLGLFIYVSSNYKNINYLNYEKWEQVPTAKVYNRGEFSPFSKVYESDEGDYLIVSRDSRFDSAGYFIVYTKSNNVGVFSASSEPLEILGFVLVPKDRGNVMLASNEKLPAKLKLSDKQIEIIGTIVEPKWQILACLKDCESQ